jgi:HAD superfamily hydrolase (TIGR01549 family)
MKNIKIISFDIGNTLIRTGNEGFCKAFSIKTGLSFEELRPLFIAHFLTKKSTLQDAVQKVCSIIGYKNPKKIIEEFQPSPVFLYDDTVPALELLLRKKVTMIAISNCTPWEAGGIESCGLNKYLQRIYYSYDIGAAKPDPVIFQYVQKSVCVSPENILHVGDSCIADVEGAKAVGWQAVLLDRDNKSIGCDEVIREMPIISSLRELIRLI